MLRLPDAFALSSGRFRHRLRGVNAPQSAPVVLVVIPARLASTRLPNKPLADLGGKPLLRHTWERTARMRRASRLIIATDAEAIREQAESWGATVAMTSPACANGTDRIASLLGDHLDAEFILNVQGDEPFIEPALLDELVERWEQTRCELVTAVRPIDTLHELHNPNCVKVVRGVSGQALYFSRSAIPHQRGVAPEQWLEDGTPYWAHIGVYGYSRSAMHAYQHFEPTLLEETEKLEQLRFLENGLSIQTVVTSYRPLGIDTPEDLEEARARLAAP